MSPWHTSIVIIKSHTNISQSWLNLINENTSSSTWIKQLKAKIRTYASTFGSFQNQMPFS
jgi:hypothetical protein